MKLCNNCSQEKSILGFSKNCYSPDGLRSVCKDCDKLTQAILRSFRKEAKAAYDRKRWINDKERLAKRYKNWVTKNRKKRNASILNRHYRKKAQKGYVPNNIKDLLFLEQEGLCFYCKKTLSISHLEHKIPLSRGGFHDISNVCLACPPCNLRKGTKTAEEFLVGGAYALRM